MRLEKNHLESNAIPNDLEVINLGGGLYEITKNDNVNSFTRETEEGPETLYSADMVRLTTEAKSKSDMIVAFIRLKYSQNDEFALTNKGIADGNNAEYVAYREYVSWCKEQAAVYFGDI
jgi:hypothetical protein